MVAASASGAAMLSALLEDPTGYGRVVRDRDGEFVAVVEEKDATPEQRSLVEINTGVLAADAVKLVGMARSS